MKTRAIITAVLLTCAAARAGVCADKTGTGTAAFLKLPVDARGAALGETAAVPAAGAMALFQNPAGLAYGGAAAFAFSHSMLVEDLSYDVLGAAVPLRSAGTVALGAQYLRYGSIDSLDNTGAPAGTISPRDSAISAGYAFAATEGFYLGGSLKYISSRISGSARTAAADLGLIVEDDEVSAGVAVQNLGKGLKFGSETSPLPYNVKLGAAAHFSGNWRWAADFNFPGDGPAWLGVGAEYSFVSGPGLTLLGRAGYNTSALDTREINGLSLGFGLARGPLSLDYSFSTMGMLGSNSRLSLAYRLGGKK
ncbi:MAG: PorV/PorQ family protein [Elusimicrobia bacterium]|nr:PorV/PorQ family protein [Elusimicrobiota bacterium]